MKHVFITESSTWTFDEDAKTFTRVPRRQAAIDNTLLAYVPTATAYDSYEVYADPTFDRDRLAIVGENVGRYGWCRSGLIESMHSEP